MDMNGKDKLERARVELACKIKSMQDRSGNDIQKHEIKGKQRKDMTRKGTEDEKK